jgi:hypothetical protein
MSLQTIGGLIGYLVLSDAVLGILRAAIAHALDILRARWSGRLAQTGHTATLLQWYATVGMAFLLPPPAARRGVIALVALTFCWLHWQPRSATAQWMPASGGGALGVAIGSTAVALLVSAFLTRKYVREYLGDTAEQQRRIAAAADDAQRAKRRSAPDAVDQLNDD